MKQKIEIINIKYSDLPLKKEKKKRNLPSQRISKCYIVMIVTSSNDKSFGQDLIDK